jgi:hypothetical protein
LIDDIGRKISKECNWLICCLIIWTYKNCYWMYTYKLKKMILLGFDYLLVDTFLYSKVPPFNIIPCSCLFAWIKLLTCFSLKESRIFLFSRYSVAVLRGRVWYWWFCPGGTWFGAGGMVYFCPALLLMMAFSKYIFFSE